MTLTGAQAHVPLSSSGSYSSNVWYSVDAYPIVLSSPDPLGRPDLGDGKNQFVYTADTPDGYLYVPGAIQVVGGTSAEANWLIGNSPVVGPLDKVNLTIDNSIIPNTFTHQWAVSGNTIYVNTPQDVNNPYPSYQFNHWIFKGLPTSFNTAADGNHSVNLLVQGAKTQTTKIQTFFNATANNYPGALSSDADGNLSYSGIPNWYYYYNQAYPSPGTYSPGAASYYDPSFNQIIISDDAHGSYTVMVFGIDASSRKVQYIGQLPLGGIHNYIEDCGHELGHKYSTTNSIEVYGSTSAHPDTDNDGLDDNWETRNGFDPNKNDTTGAYAGIPTTSPDYGKGDRECVADIQALGALLPKKSLWTADWANDGLQWGTWNQHNATADPSHPYWPWNFLSVLGAPVSSDPPANALSRSHLINA